MPFPDGSTYDVHTDDSDFNVGAEFLQMHALEMDIRKHADGDRKHIDF